jgi:hypothetical protein
VATRRVPLGGTVELTRRCNNRCEHCYNNLPATDSRALAEELHTDELNRILDEAAAAGCVWLLLTGGEIFLRPDFGEITPRKQKGFARHSFTNGTLITPEWPAFSQTSDRFQSRSRFTGPPADLERSQAAGPPDSACAGSVICGTGAAARSGHLSTSTSTIREMKRFAETIWDCPSDSMHCSTRAATVPEAPE